MITTHPLFIATLVAGALLVAPGAARAAESYDNCTGFIDSLPATIGTQGTWCLDKNLGTAITNGSAITIATNNVTIDCNDFKIGGLAAGVGTMAIGIHAEDRRNATIRNCNIRGFLYGIQLEGVAIGTSGHVVEDNRLDGNTYIGINVMGDGSTIRRNIVQDTGGSSFAATAYAIVTRWIADILDNTVSGVVAGNNAYGVYSVDLGSGSISHNRIRDVSSDTGIGYGIYDDDASLHAMRGNTLASGPGPQTVGIHCENHLETALFVAIEGNVVLGYETSLEYCQNEPGLGNILKPRPAL